MATAAQTSEPTNPTTGKDCLLALAHWILTFLFVRLLIFRGKELAATFRENPAAFDSAVLIRRFGTTDCALILAGIARALHRAAALEATLLATGAIEAMADIDRRSAIVAEIATISAGFGILHSKPAEASTKDVQQRRVVHHWPLAPTPRLSQASPAIPSLACPDLGARATGPPGVHLARGAGEVGAKRREWVQRHAGTQSAACTSTPNPRLTTHGAVMHAAPQWTG